MKQTSSSQIARWVEASLGAARGTHLPGAGHLWVSLIGLMVLGAPSTRRDPSSEHPTELAEGREVRTRLEALRKRHTPVCPPPRLPSSFSPSQQILQSVGARAAKGLRSWGDRMRCGEGTSQGPDLRRAFRIAEECVGDRGCPWPTLQQGRVKRRWSGRG